MKKIYISFIILLSTISLFAQNNTLYFMSEVPQSIQANPAFQPSCRIFFTLGDIDAYVGENGFNFNDVFTKKDTSYTLDIDKFYKNLPNTTEIKARGNIALASFGFKTGKFYFSLFNTVNIEGRFGLPKSMFGIKDGTWDMNTMTANTIDFKGFGPNVFAYLDHRLAVSYEFLPQLHFGAAFHVYNGLLTFNTNKSDLSLTTDPNTYDLQIAADLEYRTNFNATVNENADGGIDSISFDEKYYTENPTKFLKPSNLGLGVDLGAVYNMTPKIQLAASILNLGYINWKDATIATAKGNFTFSGINFSDFITSDTASFDSLGSNMLDSLVNSVDYGINAAQSFKTGMPTSINLSAQYQLTKKLTVGAMTQTKIYDKRWHQSFTLSSNFHAKFFNFGVTYSMMDHTYANIGFGFGLKLAPIQWYIVSDSWTQMANPYKLQFVSLRTGFNIILGCKKKIDIPMYDDEI